MKEIIYIGDKNKTRRRIRFTCRWCGCVFDTDEGDYTKRYSGERRLNIAGKEVWKEKYSYRTTCPICGGKITGTYTRVVGFLTKVDNWIPERREYDFPQRQFYEKVEL